MRARKTYTREFKQDAVRLILEQGYKVAEAARNLGLDRRMLGRWVEEFRSDEREAFRGNGNGTAEQQEELRQLRAENKQLKLEREILKNSPGAAWRPTPIEEETLATLDCEGVPKSRGRSFFGGIDPVKKHGPGTVTSQRQGQHQGHPLRQRPQP